MVAVLSVSFASPSVAQDDRGTGSEREAIVIGEKVTLRSEILDEDRRLLIHLPKGYESSTERYPVLYLLDGEEHFHHVTGVTRFLAHANRVPPMIVVGIANTDRDRDLKPAATVTSRTHELLALQDTVTIDYPSAGGADRFLRFLDAELVPYMNSRYRTADFRLLVGHSSGGLFALYALLSHPPAFNAYIAVSPSLPWDEGALVKRAAAGPLPDFGPDPRFVYMAVGDQEADMAPILLDFVTILELAEPEGLEWWYRILPGETHVSMPHRTIYDGLETIFADYAVSETTILAGDVSRLERHFSRATRIYGYDIRPPGSLLHEMGYVQLRFFEHPEKAVEIFRRNVELHPESPGVYDRLADALEAAGRLEEALRNREEAVRRAVETDAATAEGYREKLENLRQRVEDNEETVFSLVGRGDSLAAEGRFDLAIPLYERAAALEPDSAVSDQRLYRNYLALGAFDRAEAWQRRARERGGPTPYPGWWHCRVALTAIFRGDRESLAWQTDSLLSHASVENPRAWECAAFNEVFLRRYEDAKDHIELYIAEERPDEIPLNLGFLHLRVGDRVGGERILDEGEARATAAASQDPESWKPRFDLAEIASMRGEVDSALRHLSTAVELGLGREWWVFHLFSREALPDPVFEPLYDDPRFERLRTRIMSDRREMRARFLP